MKIENYRMAIIDNDFESYTFSSHPGDIDLHEHEFDEIIYISKGNILYHINGRNYELNPGDLVLLEKGVLHQPLLKKNDSYERSVIWVKRAFLVQNSTENTNLLTWVKSSNNYPIISLCTTDQELIQELISIIENINSNYGNDIYRKSAILKLFVLINTLFESSEGTDRNTEYYEAIDYIQNNYMHDISLDNIAESCNLSKFHFSREFKKSYGISAIKYLQKVRLNEVKKRVISGETILASVSQCGFTNYTTFLNAFKSEFGTTPSDYYRKISEI